MINDDLISLNNLSKDLNYTNFSFVNNLLKLYLLLNNKKNFILINKICYKLFQILA